LRVLLDTHAFLWWINEDVRLSEGAREVFSDGDNELLFSVASGWEMAIKVGLGKLAVSGRLGPYVSARLAENAIEVLPITLSHALGVAELPDHHRDPFDRLLISQAVLERLPILSADPEISRYPVETVW
jgi:PIN domain nuclease of toxin-antitoxin system